MRLALISDIHGNAPALEAVLADIRQAAVDQIICLGDIANAGPHPGECLDMVRDLNGVSLQGNHELYLLGQIDDESWHTCPTWSPLRWARRQLRPDQLDYIAQLPPTYELPGNGRLSTLLVHASPLNQYVGFQAHHSDEEIAHRMNGVDDVTLFCGHTHQPLYRRWSNAWLVNVGSVGMPLDGTPAAKYVIATQQRHHWHVEFRIIEYNIAHLMAEFDRVGLQKEGGVVTAAFRYQMLTGQSVANPYLARLRHYASERGLTVSQAYLDYPVPPEFQRWV